MTGMVERILPPRPAVAATLVAVALSGCGVTAVQPEATPARPHAAPVDGAAAARAAAAREALGQMAGLQDRLYKVAAPLLINNAELCKTQARNLLGFTAKNKYSYPGDYADAAQSALGYGDRLQVSGVLAGSGAARAGLRKGDGLVAADGQALPVGPHAEPQAAAVLGPLAAARASLSMTVERNHAYEVVNVPVTRACAFRVELGNADNINAYGDGQRVMLTRGMIHFAQSDEAIAYVMARDMAHNILGHVATLRSAATVGSVIDNLASVRPDLSMLIGGAGIRPMPPEMDAAADRLALYLLARAGYNIERAPGFWQRLAEQYPSSVLNGYTANHPATAQRIAAIGQTIADIKAKQAAKRPLLP